MVTLGVTSPNPGGAVQKQGPIGKVWARTGGGTGGIVGMLWPVCDSQAGPSRRGDQPQNWRATDPSTGGHQPKNWTFWQVLLAVTF